MIVCHFAAGVTASVFPEGFQSAASRFCHGRHSYLLLKDSCHSPHWHYLFLDAYNPLHLPTITLRLAISRSGLIGHPCGLSRSLERSHYSLIGSSSFRQRQPALLPLQWLGYTPIVYRWHLRVLVQADRGYGVFGRYLYCTISGSERPYRNLFGVSMFRCSFGPGNSNSLKPSAPASNDSKRSITIQLLSSRSYAS